MSYEIEYINNFSGGINVQAAPDNMIDGELSVCENADLMARGGFSKRAGVTLENYMFKHSDDTTIPIEIIDQFEFGTAIFAICYTQSGVQIRRYEDETVSVAYTYPHTVGAGIKMYTLITWEIYKGKLYVLGNSEFLVYDPVTFTFGEVTCTETDSNLTVIKNCYYIKQRGERLFCAKDNYLYFSERGRPEYWKPLNVINVITDDMEVITALHEYNNALLVFKPSSIFAWEGVDPTTDVTFKKLNTNTGTIYHRTIQTVENNVLFLGNDGVYTLQTVDDTRVVASKISYNINSLINNDLEKLSDVWYQRTARPCAIFYKDKYMLSLNSTVYIYNYDIVVTNKEFNEVWSTYKFRPELNIHYGYTHPTVFEIAEQDTYIFNFCPRSLFVYKNELTFTYAQNVYKFLSTENSTNSTYKDIADVQGETIISAPISLNVTLRVLAQNDHIRNKKYKTIFVAFRQYTDKHSSCTINARIDYTDTTMVISPDEALIYDDAYGSAWDTSVWDFSELITRRFPIKNRGKRIVITITDSTLDRTITIYGFGIEYKLKKPDRG